MPRNKGVKDPSEGSGFNRHSAKCCICKWGRENPEALKTLENDFLKWTPIQDLVDRYGDIPELATFRGKERTWKQIRATFHNHFEQKKLYEKRNQASNSEEQFAAKQMEKANESGEKVKMSDGLKAAELKAKLNKKIGEQPKNQLNLVIGRLFGDISELSNTELEGEITLIKKLLVAAKEQERKAIECEVVSSDVGEGSEES